MNELPAQVQYRTLRDYCRKYGLFKLVREDGQVVPELVKMLQAYLKNEMKTLNLDGKDTP